MWTYKFYRVDPNLQIDTETDDRYTFNVYYYFQPSEYIQWAKNGNLSNIPYSAQIISNVNFPKVNDYLPSPLNNFYIKQITNITNLNSEDNPQAVSYAVVQCLVQNKKSSQQQAQQIQSGQSETSERGLKPWERGVDDLSYTPRLGSIPMEWAYGDNNEKTPVQTTAGQLIQNLTTDGYSASITWTYRTKSSTSWIVDTPVVNKNDQTILDRYFIKAGCGLFMPPTVRDLYYFENENDKAGELYYEWSFEILFNPRGHKVEIYNAGTQCRRNGKLYDICTWYVYDPANPGQTEKKYGIYSEMIVQKKAVEEYNSSLTEGSETKTFTGDFISQPVPLTEAGDIDTNAINGGEKYILQFNKYPVLDWPNFPG